MLLQSGTAKRKRGLERRHGSARFGTGPLRERPRGGVHGLGERVPPPGALLHRQRREDVPRREPEGENRGERRKGSIESQETAHCNSDPTGGTTSSPLKT